MQSPSRPSCPSCPSCYFRQDLSTLSRVSLSNATASNVKRLGSIGLQGQTTSSFSGDLCSTTTSLLFTKKHTKPEKKYGLTMT